MSESAPIHKASSDAEMLLALSGGGIRPSLVRKVVEIHLKSKSPIQDIVMGKTIGAFFSKDEISLIRDRQKREHVYVHHLKEDGIVIVGISDDLYPLALRSRFGASSPAVLFCKGSVELLEALSVGFCGSRKASSKGLEVAADCAVQLSRHGINVVSGYAAGVDLMTHSAALREGGSTTVVLPEGIEHFRIRKSLRSLWDWSRTLVISQFHPRAPWRVENAMKRNSIICGLAEALIVVEAGRTGGSIEAGRVALGAGIPVYAPVYEAMPVMAAGNDELFGRGAKKIYKSMETGRARLDSLIEEVKAPKRGSLLFDSVR